VAADFTGKTALITGAGRGIGRAIALGLADGGAGVILLARTAGQLDETSALLREQGVPAGRISVLPADLADDRDRGRAAAAALTAGGVDILVNNAATPAGASAPRDLATWSTRTSWPRSTPRCLATSAPPGRLRPT